MKPSSTRAALAVPLGALAALLLAACGSTPAGPGTGGAPTPVRPVTSQPVAVDGGLECPASLASAEGMTVPQKPQGTDGSARLLPDRSPSSLVVCGYPVLDVTATTPLAAPFALGKRTVVAEGERADVVEALTWAPRWNGRSKACTAMGGDETAYLVGAAYGDAVVWVAAKADPNSCSNATNGDFVSGAAVGGQLDAVFGARRPSQGTGAPCTSWSSGRLGDDVSLAPDGDPAVTVCRATATGGQKATALTPERSRQVVAALRALATRPAGHYCEGSGKASDHRFTLTLAYARGPAVHVTVDPQCRPAVLGSNLESADADALVSLVEQWSPPVPGPDPDGSVSSDGSVSNGSGGSSGSSGSGSGSSGSGAPGSTGAEPSIVPPATGSGVPVPPDVPLTSS